MKIFVYRKKRNKTQGFCRLDLYTHLELNSWVMWCVIRKLYRCLGCFSCWFDFFWIILRIFWIGGLFIGDVNREIFSGTNLIDTILIFSTQQSIHTRKIYDVKMAENPISRLYPDQCRTWRKTNALMKRHLTFLRFSDFLML